MKKEVQKPPGLAKWLLYRLWNYHENYRIVGDLEEVYHEIYNERGHFNAFLWYWFQSINSIQNYIKYNIYWSVAMLENYLKITLRNINRHKGYSFINIAGLSIGMTCFILISLWVVDEMSYDNFHRNGDELYRIIIKDSEDPEEPGSSWSGLALPSVLKNNFPEVTDFTRIVTLSDLRPCQVSYIPDNDSAGRKIFKEEWLVLADPSFFQMFTFPFKKGSPETALSGENNIVITEETAQRYFGDEEPVGKVLNFNNEIEYTVTGVVKNVPSNSTIRFDFVAPIQILKNHRLNTWAVVGPGFVLLDKQTSVEEANQKIFGSIQKYGPARQRNQRVYLQPIRDIHLNANLGGTGNRDYVYIFSLIALFILIIACINFMNLSTARSGDRSKEIGLRKVVGVYRMQLVKQFILESGFMSIITLIITLILLKIVLPEFRNLTSKHLEIHYFDNFIILPGLIIFALIVGLLAGIYPAFVLSSFKPVEVLKGKSVRGTGRSLLRTVLVIIQFSISITLIIVTSIVYRQLTYIQNRDLGFDREQVLSIPIGDKYIGNFEGLKNEFRKVPGVINLTTSHSLPTNITSQNPVYWEGKSSDDYVSMNFVSVDYDYIETMKMEMVMGRSYSNDFTDNQKSYIINEAALKLTGLKDPVGKMFSIWNKEGRIIGIVKDFNYEKLSDQIKPLVMTYAPGWYFSPYFLIRISTDNVSGTIENLRRAALKYDPGYFFEYEFLDDAFEELYRSEEQLGTVFIYFAVLAIFISCLGLFGMASFMAEKRTKEIGIRKVLGATVPGIVLFLSREFMKWVLIANIIAWPIAYYAMNKWLQGFTYRTNLHIGIFAFSAFLALAIALITVSYQSVKAASSNPVEALKYE